MNNVLELCRFCNMDAEVIGRMQARGDYQNGFARLVQSDWLTSQLLSLSLRGAYLILWARQRWKGRHHVASQVDFSFVIDAPILVALC